MVLRASYWTYKKINGESAELDTAYLMLDGKCVFSCKYCTHSRNARTDNKFLSRVTWKEIEPEKIVGNKKLFKRICIQTVSYKGYKEDLKVLIPKLSDLPLSLSIRVNSVYEADEYFGLGIDTLGIAIDCASEKLYPTIRGGTLKRKLEIIEEVSKKYPGKVTSHLIIGLGETDKEVYDIFKFLKKNNVTVALFVFTPVVGTEMDGFEQPSLERYRKIQILRYLMFEENIEPNVVFDGDNIVSINGIDTIDDKVFSEYFQAFLTSGCKDCTRPYYNEKPGKFMYNYHKIEG